ncbi:MAG: LysR family transcriptional regulator, partial [Lawsonibacter sp.]|nr:LysR family transcriptional regulator [Lawsonibacter sp.]
MTLQQLKYVIAIADSGSVNSAAKSLFISQPSLSSAVKDLEEEIGFELFRRSNRGVTITAEGEEFLNYARQVCEQYTLLEERFVTGRSRKKFSVSTQHYTFAINAFVEMVRKVGMEEYEFSMLET